MIILKNNFILYLPDINRYTSLKMKYSSEEFLLFYRIGYDDRYHIRTELQRLKNSSNVIHTTNNYLSLTANKNTLGYSLREGCIKYADGKLSKHYGIYLTLERLKRIDFIYCLPYKNYSYFKKNKDFVLPEKEELEIQKILKNIF